MLRIWLLLALVGLTAVVSGCGGDESSGDTGGTGGAAGGGAGECEGVGAAAGLPPPIEWAACDPVSPLALTAECALFDVPVDYASPSAGTYALELMRIPAGNPAEKSGTVLINLGGPAVPATDYTATRGNLIRVSELGPTKDVVAMNIRGASASTRPKYIPTAIVESLRSVDRTPDDEADWQALDSVYSDLMEAILVDTPAETIETLGTRDTVRDMVRLSAALGEPRLDYLGFSYGSLTGAYFASECPGRTGNFVLDAAVAPNPDFFAGGLPKAKAEDKHLMRLAELCSKDTSCPFHGGETVEQILAARRTLAAKLEASGGEAVGKRKIFESDLHYATRKAVRLGNATAASDLWKALAAAEQNDWEALLALADANWGRQADGTYASTSRFWWVLFNDIACPKDWTLDAAKAAVAEVAKDAPELGAALVTEGLLCLHWPFNGAGLELKKTKPPPALIIGGNLDANTPVEWAPALASALDNGSYVVTHDQPGHVAWMANDCVTSLETKFLLDGKAPGVAHCDAE